MEIDLQAANPKRGGGQLARLSAPNMLLQYVRYLTALPLMAAATGAKPNLVLIVAVRPLCF